MPQVTFTDPEVASVGLTEAAARKAGYDIRVLDYDLSWVAGASTPSDGYQRQGAGVVDEEREVLIGATFVGRMSPSSCTRRRSRSSARCRSTGCGTPCPSYPTLSEVWLRRLEALRAPVDRPARPSESRWRIARNSGNVKANAVTADCEDVRPPEAHPDAAPRR